MNEKEAREYISVLRLKRAKIGKLYDRDRDRKDQPYTTKEYFILKLLEYREHRDPSLEDPSWLVNCTVDELRFMNETPVGQNCKYKTTKEYFKKELEPCRPTQITIQQKTKKMIEEYCIGNDELPPGLIHRLVLEAYNKWKKHQI